MARILVVDDDPDFVEITRTVLETEGHVVLSAASGDEALAQMRQAKPDLVLLDVMMSTILDGLSVSEEMYEDPDLKRIPIIMVSSISSTQHAAAFPTDRYVPIDAWISKPVRPDDLRATVRKVLA